MKVHQESQVLCMKPYATELNANLTTKCVMLKLQILKEQKTHCQHILMVSHKYLREI